MIGSINGAFAQAPAEKGWYGGISVGRSEVDIANDALPVVGATATSLAKDETDTAFGLGVGYQFNRNFALEGGYRDVGKFSATRTVTAPAAGTNRAGIKSSGWGIFAVGYLPLANQFSVLGKIGTAYTTTKTSLTTTGAVVLLPGVNPNPRRREWNLGYGVGLEYAFTQRAAVRLEFERLENVGDSNTGEGDIDVWSLWLKYRF
jgi:OOP family OmpA-OmpF porin